VTPKDKIPHYRIREKLIYFFPIQLLFVHLKKNMLLLSFWLLLFGMVTSAIGLKYGVPYLFLFPEYMGDVDFLSHLIVGIATGAFIMSFNISSYIVNGFRFPFLATLNRPFIKYCQNNFIIPFSFSVVYILALVQFQYHFEDVSVFQIALNVLGFVSGNLIFILVTGTYFIATNKTLFHFRKNAPSQDEALNPFQDLFSNQNKWENQKSLGKKEWKVATYISKFGRIRLARGSGHYKKATLEKVFAQNRINASYFQAGVLILLFILGLFNDYQALMIPAASSVLLFFTMLIMLASAFYSWFKGWTSIVFIALLLSANFLSTKNPLIYKNQAYGMNYDTVKADYSPKAIAAHQFNNQEFYLDVEHGIRQLENWKASTKEEKPVAVFLNVPGGGLRSAIWTMRSVDEANEHSNGGLWDNVVLISGSSGGMIGAAYLREYYWRKEQASTTLDMDSLILDMGMDKLNPVAATAVLNDVFFRFKSFQYGEHTYTRDRALAFENKLNRDTRGWLNRDLSDYRDLEFEGSMPMLILAPTISEDGRKLLISSQPISYLCRTRSESQMNENIEFSRMFEAQDADKLNFVTALRMSATFPYVFPSANLPSEPGIEILDAGIRDNYGMSNTLKFVYFFREWLSQNTSKVLIIQVRDKKKSDAIGPSTQPSIIEGITQPFGTFYNTILAVQDYQMDDQFRLAQDWYGGDLELVDLVLDRTENNPVSLSWHLTAREQKHIENAVGTDYNIEQYERIRGVLDGTSLGLLSDYDRFSEYGFELWTEYPDHHIQSR